MDCFYVKLMESCWENDLNDNGNDRCIKDGNYLFLFTCILI